MTNSDLTTNNFKTHEHFMMSALEEAAKAAENGDVPVGAVIIREGEIIGCGHNQRELKQNSVLHAEIIAIQQASNHLKSWRLNECTMYVTLEPCLMCSGAIIQSRLKKVIFGSIDPKAGACCSVTNAFDLPLHHKVLWQHGILEAECSKLLKDFFLMRRNQRKQLGTKSQRKQAALKAYDIRLEKAPETSDAIADDENL